MFRYEIGQRVEIKPYVDELFKRIMEDRAFEVEKHLFRSLQRDGFIGRINIRLKPDAMHHENEYCVEFSTIILILKESQISRTYGG